MWNGISSDIKKLKILVAAADAETMSEDVVNDEVEVIENTLSEFGDNYVQVNGLCTLEPREFCDAVGEFSPHIIHFTRRGSPTHNIKMLDSNGWVRRITGRTLAKYILMAGRKHPLSALLLFGCDVYRSREALRSASKTTVIGLNKWKSVDNSISMTRAFYTHAGETSSIVGGIKGLFSEYNQEIKDHDVEIEIHEETEDFSEGIDRYTSLETEPVLSGPIPESLDAPFTRSGYVTDEKVSVRLTESGEIIEDDSVKSGPRQYRVWFGTNRAPIDVKDPSKGFSSNRSKTVSYGYCEVIIPKYHTIGSVGDVWWRRFPRFWRNNRLSIYERKILEQETYWEALRNRFNELSVDERVLLVFLHGYNVTFDQAAIRAAQLGCDLAVPGETAFFSWPSRGKIAGYLADIDAIEASEQKIADFVVDLAAKSDATQIHLIAHSMGNLGLLRAFQRILSDASSRQNRLFKQIFLAAPDVGVDLFKDLSASYNTMSERTTMYVSARDKALQSSGLVRDYPRAGFTPPITVVNGIDTVEVTNVDLSMLGHSYIAEARPVLEDMHALMRSDGPPNRRFAIESIKIEGGLTYWRIRA